MTDTVIFELCTGGCWEIQQDGRIGYSQGENGRTEFIECPMSCSYEQLRAIVYDALELNPNEYNILLKMKTKSYLSDTGCGLPVTLENDRITRIALKMGSKMVGGTLFPIFAEISHKVHDLETAHQAISQPRSVYLPNSHIALSHHQVPPPAETSLQESVSQSRPYVGGEYLGGNYVRDGGDDGVDGDNGRNDGGIDVGVEKDDDRINGGDGGGNYGIDSDGGGDIVNSVDVGDGTHSPAQCRHNTSKRPTSRSFDLFVPLTTFCHSNLSAPNLQGNNEYYGISKGSIFPDKKTLIREVRLAALKGKIEFLAKRSCSKRYEAHCRKKPCKWRVKALRVSDDSEQWIIVRCDVTHTCVNNLLSEGQRRVTSGVVGHLVAKKFVEDKQIYTTKDIVADLQQKHDVHLTYHQAWRARKAAILEAYGDPQRENPRSSNNPHSSNNPKEQSILSQREERRTMTCSRCLQKGHNRRKCKNSIASGE